MSWIGAVGGAVGGIAGGAVPHGPGGWAEQYPGSPKPKPQVYGQAGPVANQNQWITKFLTYNPNTMGLNAYNRMLGSGYTNQQIQSAISQRGLHVGEKARAAMQGRAQPNWMNAFTGTMGNIGLSTYNRMRSAGYSVHDIMRDQPASGMIFGKLAKEQMNKDLVTAMENEKAAQQAKWADSQAALAGSQMGAGDIGADANAQGVKTDISATDNAATGSTADAFQRKPKIDPKTGLPISGLTA